MLEQYEAHVKECEYKEVTCQFKKCGKVSNCNFFQRVYIYMRIYIVYELICHIPSYLFTYLSTYFSDILV